MLKHSYQKLLNRKLILIFILQQIIDVILVFHVTGIEKTKKEIYTKNSINPILLSKVPEQSPGYIQRLIEMIFSHYFIPSFLPFSSKAMDSAILRSFVSGRLAVAIQPI